MDVISTIRAGAGAPKFSRKQEKTGRPVLVALVHEVLNQERFASLVDLTEAVKTRAAQLRIPYDSGRVAEAIRMVSHTRPILVDARPPQTRPVQPEGELVSAARAKEILRELLLRTGQQLRIIPPAPAGLSIDAINDFKREHVWDR